MKEIAMGRPKKQADDTTPAETTTPPEYQVKRGNYTVTKPADQWVVKLGGSVVYASPQKDQVDKYLELVTRK